MKSVFRTLSLETSSAAGTAALMEDDSLIELHSMGEGLNRTRGLARLVRDLLSPHELEPGEIDLLAVGLGPGSYTGIRVAAAFAHGFSQGTGCNLQGVCSFAAVASRALDRESGDRTVLVTDAAGGQKDEWYAAAFRKAKIGLEEIVPPQVLSWTELLERFDSKWLAAGKGAPRLKEILGEKVQTREEKEPDAGGVAVLARELFLSGKDCPAGGLAPLYLRKSSAEINWSLRKSEG